MQRRRPRPITFAEWRARLGLTQVQAAEALGRTRRQVQYYDAGREVPRVVRLAMLYLAEHPEELPAEESPPAE